MHVDITFSATRPVRGSLVKRAVEGALPWLVFVLDQCGGCVKALSALSFKPILMGLLSMNETRVVAGWLVVSPASDVNLVKCIWSPRS